MRVFKDALGRDWPVSITVTELGRVREATGFELGKILDDGLRRLNELAADPELLVNVLYWIVRPHAEPLKIDLAAFAPGLVGDALEAGFDALVGAFADFSPSRRRALLLAMVEKEKELADATTGQALETIRAVRPTTSSGSAGSTPASSGSTPTG